jgi:L,D-transpeptidase catalytic domain
LKATPTVPASALRFRGTPLRLAVAMKKKTPGKKAVAPARTTTTRKVTAKKSAKPARAVKKTKAESPALAEAKALEALDAAEPKAVRAAAAAKPLRNADFPRTYIKQIHVSLNDPDHWMTLTWTGPKAGSQEKGPFRTSPGAGAKGLNCNNTTTSRRSGTKCTPKGTHTVEGFQSRLNSDSRATFVTWFVRWRGIALHYFPSVPPYAASHGCVRIESKRVAQLVQENSRIDLTKVVIDGTWTKPAKQW